MSDFLDGIDWPGVWHNWGNPFVVSFAAGLLTAAVLFVAAKVALKRRTLQSRVFRLLGIDGIREQYAAAVLHLDDRRRALGAVVKRLVAKNPGVAKVSKDELQNLVTATYEDIFEVIGDMKECQARLDGILRVDRLLDRTAKPAVIHDGDGNGDVHA